MGKDSIGGVKLSDVGMMKELFAIHLNSKVATPILPILSLCDYFLTTRSLRLT